MGWLANSWWAQAQLGIKQRFFFFLHILFWPNCTNNSYGLLGFSFPCFNFVLTVSLLFHFSLLCQQSWLLHPFCAHRLILKNGQSKGIMPYLVDWSNNVSKIKPRAHQRKKKKEATWTKVKIREFGKTRSAIGAIQTNFFLLLLWSSSIFLLLETFFKPWQHEKNLVITKTKTTPNIMQLLFFSTKVRHIWLLCFLLTHISYLAAGPPQNKDHNNHELSAQTLKRALRFNT